MATIPKASRFDRDALADEARSGVGFPVREALRQLREAEGLVTFSPHRGAVVSSLSLREIEELFELRAQIESDLIRRAIPEMSREQLDRATEVLDEFDDALNAGEATRWGPLNWHFHAALYAPAQRNFTMGVLQKLHQHSDRYCRMQVLLVRGGTRANEEHRAIAAAVERRDLDAASELMRLHILGAGASLLALLTEQRGATRRAPDPRRRDRAAAAAAQQLHRGNLAGELTPIDGLTTSIRRTLTTWSDRCLRAPPPTSLPPFAPRRRRSRAGARRRVRRAPPTCSIAGPPRSPRAARRSRRWRRARSASRSARRAAKSRAARMILRYYAGEAVRPVGEVIPPQLAGALQFSIRQPLGAIALITPWNFPLAIPLWKAAPALAFR